MLSRSKHEGVPLALAFANPPSPTEVEPIVAGALLEDVGRGDITTELVVPDSKVIRAKFAARKGGIIAGLVAVEPAFRLTNRDCALAITAPDGSEVKAGDTIAEVSGPARVLLTAERTALNFLGHLSGVATATHALVEAVRGTKARITCTRKTTPGLRLLEKYAVRCGGGTNHRFDLGDAILIKDNHIKAAGSLAQVVEVARERLGHLNKVEVEVDTLEQLELALGLGVQSVLLDNMAPDLLRRAVALTKGRAVLEASGSVTQETVRAIAESGVDFISSGAITHSAPALDVGLDFL